MNPHSKSLPAFHQQCEEPSSSVIVCPKPEGEVAKSKGKNNKNKVFAKSIGVEDNDYYRKFKEGQKLSFNISTTKYFVIKFVARNLFNFRITRAGVPESHGDPDYDIYWTDGGCTPERLYKMQPY